METIIESNILNFHQKGIIRTLLYYDLFSYPLTKQELYQNHPSEIGRGEFQGEIDNLVNRGIIFERNEFYLLRIRDESPIQKRINGNKLAAQMFLVAQRNSLFVAKFPFVSGVNISGSLSKNYYDENSDIDYFIITKSNRLWLCRTLFILYYKTLSKEKKKHYCLNYFISEADLAIDDRNPFVAKELAYLVPTVNKKAYLDLLENNNWHKTFYKNKTEQDFSNCAPAQEPWYKKAVEVVFYGKFGNWIDNVLLRKTLKHWQKKHQGVNQTDFEIQFRSRKHVCKYHTHGNQNKILQLWREKIKDFENEFGINIDSH